LNNSVEMCPSLPGLQEPFASHRFRLASVGFAIYEFPGHPSRGVSASARIVFRQPSFDILGLPDISGPVPFTDQDVYFEHAIGGFCALGALAFGGEPRYAAPEAAVLPLDDPGMYLYAGGYDGKANRSSGIRPD
jgi:hypothetical protein